MARRSGTMQAAEVSRFYVRIQPASDWAAPRLGELWVVLELVFAAAIFAVVFRHFVRLPTDRSLHLLFISCGLLGWNLPADLPYRVADIAAAAKLLCKRIFIGGRSGSVWTNVWESCQPQFDLHLR